MRPTDHHYTFFFPQGAWSGKNVHPQKWQAPLCRRQKHNLLCPSEAGAHGHHRSEYLQVNSFYCGISYNNNHFTLCSKKTFQECSKTLLCWLFSEDKMHSSRDFHILFVPRRSLLCEQRLKEQGVLASFTNIDEYILDLIPFDGDLLSMEYESAFRVSSTLTF